jgi:hypothetical protein
VTRRQDWRRRLHAALAARREAPFCWGAHDCFLFAADCVLAMTGEDFAAPWRGTYASPMQAWAGLRTSGFGRVRDLIAARFTLSLRARQGDLILVARPPLDVLLIAEGAAAAWGQGEAGAARAPMPDGAEAWSV